ncbi:MAG: ABC transporter ATP-binding protein [Candidatus Nanosyncoccus sp.]
MQDKNINSQGPKDFKNTLKRFWLSIREWKIKIIVAAVLSLISTLLMVFGPMILGMMTTSATESLKNQSTINWSEINFLAFVLIAIFLLSAVIGYIQGVVTSSLSVLYEKKLRNSILEKMRRLPIGYFDKTPNGDVMSRMINDVDTISVSFAETLTQIITSFTTLVGYLVIMLYLSVTLSLIAIFAVPISTIFISRVLKKAKVYFVAERTTLGKLNSIIEENFSGQLIIKANNHAEKSIKGFDKVNDQLYNENRQAQFLSSLTFPLTHVFLNLAYAGVCMLGGYYVISGVISIGGIQAFIQYLNRFNRPITEVAQLSSTIQQILAAAERIFDFLEEAEEKPEIENSLFKQIMNKDRKFLGGVEFRNVNFSYDVKPIIKNFSVKIKPGMQVAIVGPTGAGKTTIVNLLMRFFDPNEGEILIDGVETSKMRRDEVRDLFGMVLQDTWLFSGTIMENLKYGAKRVSDEEVYKAAKLVGVDHFIKSLPNGYQTVISEDSDNISAGEKQLMTITRAVISEPLMMILDEATSNVDTRTEQLIQDAFSKLTKGRTSFVIAHRLSTIREADLILVMREGNIIEQGNHKELLAKNGFYAELYNSQFSEDV